MNEEKKAVKRDIYFKKRGLYCLESTLKYLENHDIKMTRSQLVEAAIELYASYIKDVDMQDKCICCGIEICKAPSFSFSLKVVDMICGGCDNN